LSCDTANGGLGCPSADFIGCIDPSAVESPSMNCTSNCAVNEYVAICGGIGPGRVPEPPASCRFDSANPGGFAMYCCPCE
jgi:hypothetical protein